MLQSQVNVGDLFTYGSFATLAGTTGIVYIVCGAIQQVFNFNPKWLALAISMVVSFIAAYIGVANVEQTSAAGETLKHAIPGVTYLLAFLNGFLIYMTATGTNQVLSKQNNPQNTPTALANKAPVARSFNSNWWR